VELLALERAQQVRDVARVRDQDVTASQVHAEHQADAEAEEVVQRHRAGQHQLLAGRYAPQGRAVPGLALQQVGHQVAVQQHGAAADARRAAGVLQQRDVVGAGIGLGADQRPPVRDGVGEGNRTRQIEGRHQPAHATRQVVDHGPLDRPEQVARGRDDDRAQGQLRQDLLQRVGDVLQDHDRPGAGVAQLVLERARREQRVDVDDDQPRPQDGGDGHRDLGDVGQHHRDPVTALEPLLLQPGRQRPREVIDALVADVAPEKAERRLRGMALEAAVQQRDERPAVTGVDLGRHAAGWWGLPGGDHRANLGRAILSAGVAPDCRGFR